MDLLTRIKENTVLKIEDNYYSVLSQSQYNTLENPEEIYWKYKLSNNKILVVIPSDKIFYFGNEITETNIINLNIRSLEFNGEIYERIAAGNQVFLSTSFGEPLEKNCIFSDFENKEQTKILSLAILENNTRSDIYGKYIQEKDLEIC